MWKVLFNPSKGYKLVIVVFISTSLSGFQNRNLWYNFQVLFVRKRGLVHPYFLYENESLQHCLSCDFRQMLTVFGLAIRLLGDSNGSGFQRICFLSGLASESWSTFQMMLRLYKCGKTQKCLKKCERNVSQESRDISETL